MENRTIFSQILAGYFYKRGSLDAFVRDKYPYDNLELRSRTIRRYLNGERVPSFLDAKELLKLMGCYISDDELVEILKNSKLEKVSTPERDFFAKKIDITYKELLSGEDIDKENKVLMIQSCMKELGCKTVKEFLIKLIDNEIKFRYFE